MLDLGWTHAGASGAAIDGVAIATSFKIGMLAVIAGVVGGATGLDRGALSPVFESGLMLIGIACLLLENVTRAARAHASVDDR
jgi:hypothetical protein